jgi:acetyl esterase
MRLPPWLQYKLSGAPPLRIDGDTLDPQFQLLLAVRRRKSMLGLCEPTVEKARARFQHEARVFAGALDEVAAVRDFTIPGSGGAIPVRHYAPLAAPDAPLLVYMHGGGYVIGDIESYDAPCRLLCRHAAMHVLSVGYRLAPEHRFPAAVEDTAAALRWSQANAPSLGATRVAVGGDSAGANLATVVARSAARDGTPPAAQLLIYPPTDSETVRPSRTLFAEAFLLTGRDRDQFARYYTDGTGFSGADPRVSPLYASDLQGLPPALVVTAAFDLLRDEGEAYAAALEKAGTPVRLVRFLGLGHGFVNVTGLVPSARQALIRVARDFRALVDSLPADRGSHRR